MTCNNCQCNCNNEEDTIEEFEENKEYTIGEFFKVGKEVFKVVDNFNSLCDLCDLTGEIRCTPKCDPCERKIRDSVEFILYDTLEDE